MLNPNNIQTVMPQRSWKPLEVTIKATGEKKVIKDYRFDPRLHEDAKVVGETRGTPVPKPVVSTEGTNIITPEQRFASLKSKGWAKLDSPERKNYKELKAKLEPKK